MNSSRSNPLFRAIRGPILLITLGSMLAIDHFGPYGFGRTWPVLIIVIGLMKLLERVFSPHEQENVPPTGGQS